MIRVLIPGPPPCFSCAARAVCEKAGKTLCRRHADQLVAREYPLRTPSEKPPYARCDEIRRALGYE